MGKGLTETVLHSAAQILPALWQVAVILPQELFHITEGTFWVNTDGKGEMVPLEC